MRTILAAVALAVSLPAAVHANAMIFGSDGSMYQRFDNGPNSMTFGSDGSMWQTFHNGRNSTTFGSDGSMYQEFDNGIGHGGLFGDSDSDDGE